MKSFQWLLSTIIQYILSCYEYCHQLIQKYFTGKVITFDSGKRVIIGKQIAEGGFSYIFLAYDAVASVSHQHQHGRRTKSKSQPQQQQYALKRIHCPDTELIDRCRYEADVHREVMKHKNSYVMPLYGFTIIQHDCYMLFPLCKESLRDFINRKNPYLTPSNPHTSTTTTQPPISEVMVLQLFRQICSGVQALHTCGYSHRDIKIENVMILSNEGPTLHTTTTGTSGRSSSPLPHLVIMDFGSAGPINVTIQNRKQILEMIEQASQHTTMPYRPPELFDGGIRLPPTTTNTTTVLDYRAVDVWSLGCTLHAIMYGVSPFECEFNVATSSSTHNTNNATTTTMGNIKIVDCTHLSILGNIPVPKYLPISSWYSDSIRKELLLPMLRQEPNERPKLETIIQTIEGMIVQLGGAIMDMPPAMANDSNSNSSNINNRYSDRRQYRDDVGKEDEDTDGIALLSRMA